MGLFLSRFFFCFQRGHEWSINKTFFNLSYWTRSGFEDSFVTYWVFFCPPQTYTLVSCLRRWGIEPSCHDLISSKWDVQPYFITETKCKDLNVAAQQKDISYSERHCLVGNLLFRNRFPVCVQCSIIMNASIKIITNNAPGAEPASAFLTFFCCPSVCCLFLWKCALLILPSLWRPALWIMFCDNFLAARRWIVALRDCCHNGPAGC